MRLLLLSLILGSCTGSVQSAGPTVAGEVTAVDLSPMAYDGNATVDVRTAAGETVRVAVPARTNLCQAQGLGTLGEIAVGDRVEVQGERSAEGVVTPCLEATHYLRVVERANPSSRTVRGVYESGFERSAFRPCDRPDEVWWLVPDEAFADRLNAIRQQEAPDGGRGLRLFVEATVIGDLAEGSEFGHLGDYEHQLTVRETRDMVYLGRDLDTPPACR